MRITPNQVFHRTLNNLMNIKSRIAQYQQQIDSGKKIQSASDDPLAAAGISLMRERISISEQMQKNKDGAKESIAQVETNLNNVVRVLQRVRELQVQAGNSALSEENRKAIGIEAQGLLDQMVSLANDQSNGSYLYSGSKTSTVPFSMNNLGQYIYNGDDTQRFQTVSNQLNIPISESGSDVFMRIPNGNGQFSITTNPANTGTVVLSSGTVTNSSAYVLDDYNLQFALNSSNQLVYMVSGVASGDIIPPTGLVDDAPLYVDNMSLIVNGMEIKLSGNPQAGDSFTVTPANNASIFSTLQRMIANLDHAYTSPADKAQVQTENNQIQDQIDSALDNILNYQAQAGTRLNQLDIIEQVNADLLDSSIANLSQLEDVDLAEAISNLSLQTLYLQAAQQSFVKIQNLSIFNYI